jgi:hypothetical protein
LAPRHIPVALLARGLAANLRPRRGDREVGRATVASRYRAAREESHEHEETLPDDAEHDVLAT